MTSAAEPAQPRPAATSPAPGPPTAPTASYRLQLQPGFTLHDATAAVPYLAALGVSHLHLSPLLEATPAPPTATTPSTTAGSASSSVVRARCAPWPPPPTGTACG